MAKNIRKVQHIKAEKRMERYFLITKVFLALTPVICYFYVSLRGMMQGIGFQEVLETQPNMTIVFLIAMLNPYVAYLLHLIEKKLKEQDECFAVINMVLLLVAQMLTMNVFYFMMLGYVFYKAINYYQLPVKATLRSMTLKMSFYHGGGSMLIIAFSTICFFATIQLM